MGLGAGAGAWNAGPGAGQSANNPIPGMHGLNIGALPVNPALMAALNQVYLCYVFKKRDFILINDFLSFKS